MRAIIKIILIFTLFPAQAEVFTWIDGQGETHFGDNPPTNRASERVNINVNVNNDPFMPELLASSHRSQRVIMYGTSWCSVCKSARRYFNKNGVNFTEYDVETSFKGKRDYEKMGKGGVPILLVGKERINGFNIAEFEKIYQQ